MKKETELKVKFTSDVDHINLVAPTDEMSLRVKEYKLLKEIKEYYDNNREYCLWHEDDPDRVTGFKANALEMIKLRFLLHNITFVDAIWHDALKREDQYEFISSRADKLYKRFNGIFERIEPYYDAARTYQRYIKDLHDEYDRENGSQL